MSLKQILACNLLRLPWHTLIRLPFQKVFPRNTNTRNVVYNLSFNFYSSKWFNTTPEFGVTKKCIQNSWSREFIFKFLPLTSLKKCHWRLSQTFLVMRVQNPKCQTKCGSLSLTLLSPPKPYRLFELKRSMTWTLTDSCSFIHEEFLPHWFFLYSSLSPTITSPQSCLPLNCIQSQTQPQRGLDHIYNVAKMSYGKFLWIRKALISSQVNQSSWMPKLKNRGPDLQKCWVLMTLTKVNWSCALNI